MTGEECKGFIAMIHQYYRKEYPQEALKRAWPHLQGEPAKAMFNAVERLMLENTSSMPALQRVIDLVKQEGVKIQQKEIAEREERAQREKREFQEGQKRAFTEDSGIAKKTVALVRALMLGRITRADVLEGMRHLDREFPSAGFAVEGAKLQRFYEQSGLDLHAKPTGGDHVDA